MIDSYIKALSMAQGRKRKLANNTYLNPLGAIEHGTDIAVRLHSTDIVIFHADDSITLDSGGWKTVTTKDRMNRYLPASWHVYQERGVWYLRSGGWNTPHGKLYAYADGIKINADGTVTGEGVDPKAQLRLRTRARNFAKAYINALQADNVPAPSNGDCWGCLMVATDGSTPLGGPDHILSHIEEGYYVPSLLVRAIERFPVSIAAKQWLAGVWAGGPSPYPLSMECFAGIAVDQLRKALTRYLYEQLGTAG